MKNCKMTFVTALVLCLGICFSLTGCGNNGTTQSGGTGDAPPSNTTNPEKKIVLKSGHIQAPDHPWHIAMEGMAKDVADKTGGAVEMQVFASAQLGGERDVAEGLKLDTVQMGVFGTGALQALDKRLIVEELPYAWPTRESAYEALDGELGDALNKILKEQNIIGISYWESGYRHITNSKRPINSVADLKAMKLRVPEAEMRIDTFKDLGALPTPLAFSEVFTALQQGTVDGQENPLATIYSSKFYEVQKHLALSGHIWGSAVVAVGEPAWTKLSEEQQKAMIEGAETWKVKERELITKSDDELLQKMKDEGVEVTEPDVAQFKAAVEGVWTKYEADFGKELVDIVRKYSK